MTKAEAKAIVVQYRTKLEARGYELNTSTVARYLDRYRHKLNPEIAAYVDSLLVFSGDNFTPIPSEDPTKL